MGSRSKQTVKRRTVAMTISMRPDLAKSVRMLAKEQGRTVSDVVNGIVGDGLDSERAMVAAFSSPLLREGLLKLFSQQGTLKALAEAIGEGVSDEQLLLFKRGLQAGAGLAPVVGAVRRKGK